MVKKGIIFSGANYLDLGRKSGGATRISNFCEPYGWDIEVVDYFPFWEETQLKDFLKKTVDENTKFIGFSWTWLIHIKDIKERIKLIKSWYPNLLYIVGGQSPFNESLDVDYYITGYGEVATLLVLEHEYNNKSLPQFKPFYGGKMIDGISLYSSHDLKEYNVVYKERDFITPNDLLTIELSRGCKFACKFCTFPYIGIKEDTSRSEESMYRELKENYDKWGVTKYLIADDTMNDRREKLIKFKNVVNRLDFQVDFSTYIRLDLIASNEEQLEILSESNVWGHFYGIETFNHESGKIVGKGMAPSLIKETLLKVREYFLKNNKKYRGTCGMVAGLPKENVDSMKSSHEWYKKFWSDQTVVWHALNIIKGDNIIQAFGRDLKKYGYEEIPKPVSDNYIEILKRKSLIPKSFDDMVWWKNEYTNSMEMFDLVEEFRKDKFGINNWSLFPYLNHWGIDKALGLRTTPYDAYVYGPYNEISKKHISDYIQNKLNQDSSI